MSNVLNEEKKQQVIALGRLGWSLRRIERGTGVRRETAATYLKAAGVPLRPPGGWGRHDPKPAIEVITDSASEQPRGTPALDTVASKPANEVNTDFGGELAADYVVADEPKPGRSPSASSCEPYREVIAMGLSRGRNAMAIWQDLVDTSDFAAGYQSVRRFVGKLLGSRVLEACPVIETAPGEEAQVDYGEGPMVRDAQSGKYRRTRLFVLTLGYSRKSVRLLVFHSGSQIWAELHEKAFRRLGGATKIVVLDNLREAVVNPDLYDPTLNPLYRDVLRHYGATPLPCRVAHPDRKGKVESGVGHAQKTPLKGLRFETLDEAQTYLDRWEERWADTRIHGTTKRQVAAMFAEEKPALIPLPVEPFRYYQSFGTTNLSVLQSFGTTNLSVLPIFRYYQSFGTTNLSVLPIFRYYQSFGTTNLSVLPIFRYYQSFGTTNMDSARFIWTAAWKSRPLITARRRDGSADACRCNGISGM